MRALQPVLAVIALAACGPPSNQVHGTIAGQPLEPKSVLTFQVEYAAFGGAAINGSPQSDLIIALYDSGGGCELLDQARPAAQPAQLWIDVSSTAPSMASFGPPPTSLSLAPHTAYFWPKGVGVCAPIQSLDSVVDLDTPRGEISGTFDLVFPDGTLTGSFHATPCGMPPLPRSSDCL